MQENKRYKGLKTGKWISGLLLTVRLLVVGRVSLAWDVNKTKLMLMKTFFISPVVYTGKGFNILGIKDLKNAIYLIILST